MKVLILGIGSAIPTNYRNPSAQLLMMESNHFLIDCGEGTQNQLRKFKAGFQKINAIFISHLHGDHYLGLMGLLWTCNLLGRVQPIKLFGPPALLPIIKNHLKASESKLQFELDFKPTKSDGLNLLFENKNIEVFSFPLKHKVPTTGFLFREKPKKRKIDPQALKKWEIPIVDRRAIKDGKDFYDEEGQVTIPNAELTLDPNPSLCYAYCSDTAFDKDIVQYLDNVNTLYHEATFLERDRDRAISTKHSTAKEAAKIARSAKVGKLILGHFSNRYKELDEFVEESTAIFSNTILAEEGEAFEIA